MSKTNITIKEDTPTLIDFTELAIGDVFKSLRTQKYAMKTEENRAISLQTKERFMISGGEFVGLVREVQIKVIP